MAQAVGQHTPIRDLDDAVDYVAENLRCTKEVAVCVMNQHYHGQLDGRLVLETQDLVCDDEPRGGWVTTNAQFWDLKLERDGHVQLTPRIELWRKTRSRIAEDCDARAIWPPHSPVSETAPDQQPEDRVDPDPIKTEAGYPPAGVSQNKLGAPVEHDWDDYEQKFLQLWQERGDFQLPQNRTVGWDSQAAAARTLLDYIQKRCKDGEEPHEKTVARYISGWVKKLRAAVEHN